MQGNEKRAEVFDGAAFDQYAFKGENAECHVEHVEKRFVPDGAHDDLRGGAIHAPDERDADKQRRNQRDFGGNLFNCRI